MNATSRRNEEVEIARERVEINKVVDAINLESIKKLNYENVVTSERIPGDLMFSLSQVIALPSAMVSEYNRVQYKCDMGLFAEINTAWIIIDNKLYLWNYVLNRQIQIFDELDQVIVSVALVNPNRDIFTNDVKYLLVVATPTTVFLYEISNLADNNSPLLEIRPTKYRFLTGGVDMLKIVGTIRGRIFLAGVDGCLYEIGLEMESGLLTERNRLINHSRSLIRSFVVPSFLKYGSEVSMIDIVVGDEDTVLFALLNDSTIEMYNLEGPRYTVAKAPSYTSFETDLRTLKYPVDTSTRIISIATVNVADGRNVLLSATTNQGHLLMFTLNEAGHLVLSKIQRCNIDGAYHQSYFKDGLSIMAASANKVINYSVQNVEQIVCVSYERAGQNQRLRLGGVFDTDSKILAIAEAKPEYQAGALLDNQVRRFICLTTGGIAVLTKRRHVDIIADLLDRDGATLGELLGRFGDEEQAKFIAAIIQRSSSMADKSTLISQYLKSSDAIRRAFTIYFATIVRMFWTSPFMREERQQKRAQLSPTLVDFLVDKLTEFYQFLSEYVQFNKALSTDTSQLDSLLEVISRTLDGLRFMSLMDTLSSSQQFPALLTTKPFEHFVVTQEGKKELLDVIYSIVTYQPDLLPTIQNKLELCTALFDQTKLTELSAIVDINTALKNTSNRKQYLMSALEKYISISGSVDVEKVCRTFMDVQFYTGVLEFVLAAVSKVDPLNLALEYYYEQKDSAYAFWVKRQKLYNCAIAALDELMSEPGPRVPRYEPTIRLKASPQTTQEREAERKNVMERILASRDELLHVCLYQYYNKKGKLPDLFQHKTLFMEPYLRKHQLHELRADYFAFNGETQKAFMSLVESAQAPEVPIEKKADYLTKAATLSRSEARFHAKISELLDVVRVQNIVRDEVHDKYQEDSDLNRLSTELLDVTQIYKIAARLHLAKSCLLCLMVSECDDQGCAMYWWNMFLQTKLSERKLNDLKDLCQRANDLPGDLRPILFPAETICQQLLSDGVEHIVSVLSGVHPRMILDALDNIYNKEVKYHNPQMLKEMAEALLECVKSIGGGDVNGGPHYFQLLAAYHHEANQLGNQDREEVLSVLHKAETALQDIGMRNLRG